ncbi:MAG: hypothetical protein ACYS76_15395, partial [Planctomycetota bacterium]
MRRIILDAVVQKAVIILPALCLLVAGSAAAQSGGPYVLDWSSIDGGGGQSSGGPYSLTGTVGQPDA